jgi:prepilin-type N-terminal cleavage/methylation domain-containing protein
MKRQQQGFTLIEIAIVLVIIGLLLGGVLKGQELITGARVRNIIQQQDGVKAAYFGFLDRYRALPGDYANAKATITNITDVAGCGNDAGNGDGDGQIELATLENILAWEHLSKANFINGTYTCGAAATPASAPSNPYGQFLDLIYDGAYAVPDKAPAAVARHNLKTGAAIPSDILAEIDRKTDDGNATAGSFRAMTGATVGEPATCYAVDSGVWVASPGGPNCGGATIF